ncbi:Peptidoglycan-binding (PGRP) domain of peptidoglycan hydrolases-containing protein [Parafrankia irregularis]|uniref:Peptidoglycan-binding (PGRP) domain of peptidoglycan hydrolases-containing protein n=1 Tax=Parafrankia irregularis TaxID=795642 RepID=A0A0S4QPF8_9ACTN|nr:MULTISPECIES: L,D-transpeptidase family protein [Parafrankia]MBE3206222.1 peptidoglycan-binding protein [Parafrankia sp. CH37]CUU57557.1 Peptidoglycan-binding (PGRP) domain of peptidoglycan hydrolases-containing protein [Parafrankia irregularis]
MCRSRVTRSLIVLPALVGMALVGACGSDSPAATGPAPSPSAPVSTTTAPAPATPSGLSGPASPAGTPSASATAGATPTASPAPTASPTATSAGTTPSPAPTPTGPPILRPGATGPEILELQRQLMAAGYWLGTPDGTFGLLTQQAVLAVQKTAGIGLDGLVGPATRAAIARGTRPDARSTQGFVLEVDKGRQLLKIVRDGHVETTLNTSTGTEQIYYHDGVQYLADTPPGTWRMFRQVNGVDHGSLGDLYRPKYFHADGIAIHGYASVPARAASHGCVRVTNAAMDWLWSSGNAEIGTTVLVY